MKTLFKILIIILVTSFTVLADQQVTLSWTEVTEDTNDNPIEVFKYLAYCDNLPAVEILAPDLLYVFMASTGNHGCYVTSVAIINGYEVESLPSNIASKNVKRAKPKKTVLSID